MDSKINDPLSSKFPKARCLSKIRIPQGPRDVRRGSRALGLRDRIFSAEKARSGRGTPLFHDGRVVSTAARWVVADAEGSGGASRRYPTPGERSNPDSPHFLPTFPPSASTALLRRHPREQRTSTCVFFPSEVAPGWLPANPSAAVPLSPRTAARRSAIVGVEKGFVEGALGAGVCAVRNFYADDGAVYRGSISEQHPLDFQGFRIDSNSAPRRNFTPFLVRDILVPACPARNIAAVAPTFSSFSYFLPRHCPSIGVNHRCVDGNQW